ncbi:Endoribonuclease YbeY [bioreactor metagenome]|uniref:Endoribonuclease YbeY n=1 Tax=bioreactor metagenome TaxID=1076179 RepID=A0A645EPY7_9ZZZZ
MIDLQTELEQVPQSALELIRSAVSASLENGGVRGDVCVLITDAEEIQSLNRTYRKIDRITDVLTFPAWEGEAILCPPDEYLGDIAICYERAVEQAEEYNHSLERELAFLAVHGSLHLMGYDHMTKEDEAAMFAKQEEVLVSLGLTRE